MLPFEYDQNLPTGVTIKRGNDFNLVILDAPYKSDIPHSQKIVIYEYENPNASSNLIFLHGIGNGHIPYLTWFAKYFRNSGINTYFLILPYHLARAPEDWQGGELFLSASPEQCRRRFHQAVIDVRKTIDYIQTKSDLPINIMGFSFGGMISTLALSVDKRLKKGILAFTGGDWRWINWYSPHTQKIREEYQTQGNEMGCHSENHCVKLRGNALTVIKNFKTIDDIFAYPVKCFHYDPISFAKFINQKVLLFSGIFDKIIPYNSSNNLYKALSNAKRITLPAGHKTSYLFKKFIAKETIKFLLNSN
ncbi:alpha/beta hydrolase [Thermosipho ferrireducens]|uniref:Alpha/beta hydrolase n=1 Tax=Thermosipho ferrireducens TaxID=2571116 RepID=A0ABX7S6T2_9BACT|nr:alpha/beta hydrolase [Thermosipho ferrireducens]QTA38293.1 alpha/beta hydrolase [Thermosipho ferrireducens]